MLVLQKSWWIVLLGGLLGTVLGGFIAFRWTSSMPWLFHASALIEIERTQSQRLSLNDYVARMVTIDSLRQVVRELDLAEEWEVVEKEAMDKLRRRLQAGVQRESNLVRIQARDETAQQAEEIVAAFIRVYVKRREQQDRDEAKQAVLSLKAAIRDQEEEVDSRKSTMTKYLGEDSTFFEALHSNPHAIDQYHEARRDLETSERVLVNLQDDLDIQESREYVPKERVVVHKEAAAASEPVSTNQTMWIAGGGIGGLFIALPVFLVVGWVWSTRRSPAGS